MSTIITTNPYTFTVQDNMSIKAVFEDNGITVSSLSGVGGYSPGYGNSTWSFYCGNTKWASGTLRSSSDPTINIKVSFPQVIYGNSNYTFTYSHSSQSSNKYFYAEFKSGNTTLYKWRSTSSGDTYTPPSSWNGKTITISLYTDY